MRAVLILLALFSFLLLLGTAILTGFNAIPLATGAAIAIASFFLGLTAVIGVLSGGDPDEE